jgi:hypothetical protein
MEASIIAIHHGSAPGKLKRNFKDNVQPQDALFTEENVEKYCPVCYEAHIE